MTHQNYNQCEGATINSANQRIEDWRCEIFEAPKFDLISILPPSQPEMLHITAQQSRFHNEAIEGSALKEVSEGILSHSCTGGADRAQIVVKDLSISIGQREILSHAEFQLQVGKHYVLVGRNGIGKSSKL